MRNLLQEVSYNVDKIRAMYLVIAAGKGECISKGEITYARQIAAQVCGVDAVKLCTTNTTKIEKSNKLGQEFNIIMHFAPVKLSGFQVCPMASQGCAAACLNTSGHGRYDNVQQGRIRKTQFFFKHRELFGVILWAELHMWQKRANNLGMTLAARLNGTSDISWEVIFPWIFSEFSKVQFYDYTKIAKRFERTLPTNYRLTFSRSESNEFEALGVLQQGGNVAVVFSNLEKALQDGWQGVKVIDGVSTDRRFADPKGVIVGLKALERARRDSSGFVVRN